MKVRSRDKNDKIELQMTPMIDIVFQLLVFFIMTFNVVKKEGDFNILMPGKPADATLTEVAPTKLQLRMTAAGDGSLASMTLNDVSMAGGDPFQALHQDIRGKLPNGSGPASDADYEIEIKCDYGLKYENVIKAINAVNGYRPPGGDEEDIVTLIDKIRFAAPVK